MKKISLKVLTLMVVLTTGLVAAATSNDGTTLDQIAGYRQWTRINQRAFAVVLDPASEAI